MNYLQCGCGQQIDTAGRRAGDVVVCPSCRHDLPIPGESAEDFVRQLATGNTPGVFAHVRLDTGGADESQRSPTRSPQPKPAGWFRRLLQRLGLE